MAPLEVFDGTEALCLPLSLFLLRHLNGFFQGLLFPRVGESPNRRGEERPFPSKSVSRKGVAAVLILSGSAKSGVASPQGREDRTSRSSLKEREVREYPPGVKRV